MFGLGIVIKGFDPALVPRVPPKKPNADAAPSNWRTVSGMKTEQIIRNDYLALITCFLFDLKTSGPPTIEYDYY